MLRARGVRARHGLVGADVAHLKALREPRGKRLVALGGAVEADALPRREGAEQRIREAGRGLRLGNEVRPEPARGERVGGGAPDGGKLYAREAPRVPARGEQPLEIQPDAVHAGEGEAVRALAELAGGVQRAQQRLAGRKGLRAQLPERAAQGGVHAPRAR